METKTEKIKVGEITVITIQSDPSLQESKSNPIVQSILGHGECVPGLNDGFRPKVSDPRDRFWTGWQPSPLELYFLAGSNANGMLSYCMTWPRNPAYNDSDRMLRMYLSRIDQAITKSIGDCSKCLFFYGESENNIPLLIREWAQENEHQICFIEQFDDYEKCIRPMTDFYFCSEFKLLLVNHYDSKIPFREERD